MHHPALPVLAKLCRRAHGILAPYYAWHSAAPEFDAFLVAPEARLGRGGAVLLEEDAEGDSLFLGICFGEQLAREAAHRAAHGSEPGLHAVAVVAEETSHFMTLVEAADRGVAVSRLDLETLGEIDRFLALLHWGGQDGEGTEGKEGSEGTTAHAGGGRPNASAEQARLLSIRDVCDAVFTGERFAPGPDASVYVEAEARAFSHLRRAFARRWDDRGFDARRVDPDAARYLEDVRESVLGGARTSQARKAG
jgi:hypothetical protein